ncbi:hypothetical protein ACSTB0_13660, partial [Faecalibacterium wellingii]
KSGPDYIDPMFHRSALQVDSHNLDLFLSDRTTVQALYARCAASTAQVIVVLPLPDRGAAMRNCIICVYP